jgi:hypothetical protein
MKQRSSGNLKERSKNALDKGDEKEEVTNHGEEL